MIRSLVLLEMNFDSSILRCESSTHRKTFGSCKIKCEWIWEWVAVILIVFAHKSSLFRRKMRVSAALSMFRTSKNCLHVFVLCMSTSAECTTTFMLYEYGRHHNNVWGFDYWMRVFVDCKRKWWNTFDRMVVY